MQVMRNSAPSRISRPARRLSTPAARAPCGRRALPTAPEDATGELLALCTDQWRLYDLMWGLHIMDPQTREDTNNPFVIGFGALLGCILLFRRRKARVRIALPSAS